MRRLITLLFLALLAGVQPALAAPILFTALLSGSAEEPPTASPGTGTALVTIDPVAHTLRVEASFSDLLGLVTASHIHVINGPGDANALDTLGPVATTTPTFPFFPLGVTSGLYDRTFDTTQSSSYNPSFATSAGGILQAETALFDAIMTGRAYFNIHSTIWPGGEIRGFLAPVTPPPVPEPSILLLVASGAAGFLRRARRRA